MKGKISGWQPRSELYEPLSLKFLKRFLCNIFIYYYYSVWGGDAVRRQCEGQRRLCVTDGSLLGWISGFQGYRANTFTCWAITVAHMEAIIKWRKRGCPTTLSDLPPLRSLLHYRSTLFLTPANVTIQGWRMYQHRPFMFNVTYQDVCLGSTDRKFARCNTKESKKKLMRESFFVFIYMY